MTDRELTLAKLQTLGAQIHTLRAERIELIRNAHAAGIGGYGTLALASGLSRPRVQQIVNSTPARRKSVR
jgi:hypothetical protein